MTAPKPRWFRFSLRWWAKVNRPVTSETFDEQLLGLLGPLHSILRCIVLATFSVFMWMILPTWKFALYVTAGVLVVTLFVKHRLAQRPIGE